MTKKQAIQLFGERKAHTMWGGEQEKWLFPIVDTGAMPAGSSDQRPPADGAASISHTTHPNMTHVKFE